MNYLRLRQIPSLFFTHREVADRLGITLASAKVACTRYVRSGYLVRLKRDLYVLKECWQRLTKEELFILANQIQIPSYLSFTTALSFYGLTTQIQQNFIESVAIKRTKDITVAGVTFRYTKMNKVFYEGFVKQNGFFIARPEKALVDGLCLASLGRYHLDWQALEWRKIDQKKVNVWLKKYPQRLKRYWRKYARPNRTGEI